MLILRINTKKIKINLIGILIYKILNKNWLTYHIIINCIRLNLYLFILLI